MKLQAELKGEKHAIEIKRDGEKLSARVDNRDYELEASEVEPNVYLFKYDHRIFHFQVIPRTETPGYFESI